MKYTRPLATLFSFLFAAANAMSAEGFHGKDRPWAVIPQAGFSPYFGFIGIEGQFKNLALTAGVPPRLAWGAKYYVKPYEKSWFFGGFFRDFKYSSDAVVDGVVKYDEHHWSDVGIGLGYRWVKSQNFTVELSLAVARGHDIDRSSIYRVTRNETFLFPFPGVPVGYVF